MGVKPRIAIVGATGLVGSSLIELINEGRLAASEVYLLASLNSAGERLEVLEKHRRVELLEQFDFEQVDVAFFAVPAEVATAYASKAVEAGVRVLDASAAFAADTNVPLAVAGVNLDVVEESGSMLVSVPTSAALAMAKVLKPLHDAAQLISVNATVCEPASYFGHEGVNALAQQAVKLLNGQENNAEQKLAFNVQSQVGQAEASGHTRFELLTALETLRLLGLGHLDINVSSLQVPVFYGQTITLHLSTMQYLAVEAAEEILNNAGIVLKHDGNATALTNAVGSNDIGVSRIRADMSAKNGLNLTLISDSLRAGVAINMLQIAQNWLKS